MAIDDYGYVTSPPQTWTSVADAKKQMEIDAVVQEVANEKLAQLMNTPADYDAIWETIPEQYQKIVTHPTTGGVTKAHSALYNPYSIGVKVSGEGTVNSTPSPTPSTNKDGDQMLGDGTDKGYGVIPSGHIYIWIDNSWHYQGQAGDPNYIPKDQFVKNYYDQKEIVNQVVQTQDTPPIDYSNILNLGNSWWNPSWGTPSDYLFSTPNVYNNNNEYLNNLSNALNTLTS